MTGLQFYTNVQRELNQLENTPEMNTVDLKHWLNKALKEWYEEKYIEFQRTQKITDEISPLITNATITSGSISSGNYTNSYLVDLSSITDYRHVISERVKISFTNLLGTSVEKYVNVKPVTHDRVNYELKNPLGSHVLRYDEAEPLRLNINDNVDIITDGNYSITEYKLNYLKEPTAITNSTSTYVDLPKFVHYDIVEKAVRMIIEQTGNTNRYQTSSIEETNNN